MRTLLHLTAFAIFVLCVSASKNLLNMYTFVRLSGALSTRVRKQYWNELIAFCVIAVVAAVMVIVSLVAVEVVW